MKFRNISIFVLLLAGLLLFGLVEGFGSRIQSGESKSLTRPSLIP